MSYLPTVVCDFMKRLISNLAYGVAGLLLLVGGIVLLYLHRGGEFVAFSLVSGTILMLISWALFYKDKRDKTQHHPAQAITKADMLKCANIECAIPFERIRANFLKLSKSDDTIVAEKDYLSWNSGTFAEIRVTKLCNENWVCIYWERASWIMSDSVMKSICEANDIQMPSEFHKMEPHGIAIYTQNNLQIYPAMLKEDFTDAFLDTVLSQGSEFESWIKDYYEEP